jgi:hypothetical protein
MKDLNYPALKRSHRNQAFSWPKAQVNEAWEGLMQ